MSGQRRSQRQVRRPSIYEDYVADLDFEEPRQKNHKSHKKKRVRAEITPTELPLPERDYFIQWDQPERGYIVCGEPVDSTDKESLRLRYRRISDKECEILPSPYAELGGEPMCLAATCLKEARAIWHALHPPTRSESPEYASYDDDGDDEDFEIESATVRKKRRRRQEQERKRKARTLAKEEEKRKKQLEKEQEQLAEQRHMEALTQVRKALRAQEQQHLYARRRRFVRRNWSCFAAFVPRHLRRSVFLRNAASDAQMLQEEVHTCNDETRQHNQEPHSQESPKDSSQQQQQQEMRDDDDDETEEAVPEIASPVRVLSDDDVQGVRNLQSARRFLDTVRDVNRQHDTHLLHNLHLTDEDENEGANPDVNDNDEDEEVGGCAVLCGQLSQLRDYQRRGVAFILQRLLCGVGAILGDEMGLGKTAQAIAVLHALRLHRESAGGAPSLVVCPLSVLDNWMNELKMWCPSLRAVRLHGPEKQREVIRKQQLRLGNFDVLVTTFETLVPCAAWLAHSFAWRAVVVDEAHRLKNAKALSYGALQRVRRGAPMVLLTGTPLQNDLHELWALLKLLLPGVFDSEPVRLRFKAAFDLSRLSSAAKKEQPQQQQQQQQQQDGGTESEQEDVSTSASSDQSESSNKEEKEEEEEEDEQFLLSAAHRLLLPLMIRRTKSALRTKLPPKTETMLYVTMSPYQRFWYRRLLGRLVTSDKSQDFGFRCRAQGRDPRKLMSLLVQLRKVCSHPFLLPDAEPVEGVASAELLCRASRKMAVLDKLLERLKKEGHRALIFSGFTRVLDLVEQLMRARGHKYYRLDGSTHRVRRKLGIAWFNAPRSDKFAYLISTRAGGLGVNLHTADTVIFFDSDWNPQADVQAMARAHRIGQRRPVRIFRLVTSGSVEERVVLRAQQKLYLDAVVTGTATNASSGTSTPVTTSSGDEEQLNAATLLNFVTFGAENVYREDASDDVATGSATLTDAELDQMLQQSAVDVDEKKMREGQQDLSSAVLLHAEPASVRQFEGEEYKRTETMSDVAKEAIDDSGSINSALRVIAAHQTIAAPSNEKRKSVARTKVIGEDAVLRDDLSLSWHATANHVHARQRRQRFRNQDWCFQCGEGGEILLCPYCPRSFHRSCVGLDEKESVAKWSCPAHRCAECGLGASQAGFLFRCVMCAHAYCEDHVPPPNFQKDDNFDGRIDIDEEWTDDDIYKWVPPSTVMRTICGKECADFYKNHYEKHKFETEELASRTVAEGLLEIVPDLAEAVRHRWSLLSRNPQHTALQRGFYRTTKFRRLCRGVPFDAEVFDEVTRLLRINAVGYPFWVPPSRRKAVLRAWQGVTPTVTMRDVSIVDDDGPDSAEYSGTAAAAGDAETDATKEVIAAHVAARARASATMQATQLVPKTQGKAEFERKCLDIYCAMVREFMTWRVASLKLLCDALDIEVAQNRLIGEARATREIALSDDGIAVAHCLAKLLIHPGAPGSRRVEMNVMRELKETLRDWF